MESFKYTQNQIEEYNKPPYVPISIFTIRTHCQFCFIYTSIWSLPPNYCEANLRYHVHP